MSTIPETISVLEKHNKWRRGDETIPQPDPFEIGVAIGDAVRLLRELAAERAKVKLREAWLCGHTDGIDCGSGQRSTTDFVTFDEAEAKGHVAKYKGSWTTEGWYRAVPVRASVALAATKEARK